MLTVVMYHYVRDLPRTRFPAIHGMRLEHFEGQLDYLTKHYTILDVREILAAIRGETTHIEDGIVLRQVIELTLERSEEHTSELQSQSNLVCRLLLEKK